MSDTDQVSGWMRGGLPRAGLLALIFLIIVANGVVALDVLHDLHKADAHVDRALRASYGLKDIEDLTARSARDQRAYRVSGDASRLEAYRRDEAALPPLLADLQGLMADNDAQSRRLDALAKLIAQDAAQLSATLTPIEPHFDTGKLPAELVASIDRTNGIAAAVGVMEENERTLLHNYLAAIDVHDTIALGTVVLAAIGSVVLIVVIVRMLRRDARRTEQAVAANSGALRDSELRFRRMFEESPLGILVVAQETRSIIQANPAFCRMLGYGVKEPLNKSYATRARL